MEISSVFVGLQFKTYKTRVDARVTMNYAAAINDHNPCYFDDRQAQGLRAHPLTPVAVTWPVIGRIWEFIEADDFPLEALLTQVHHTETIVHHRSLVPGDMLTIQGMIAAIKPHRSGTRVVIRLEAFDEKQRPVFTEYCGALLRGVTCVDDGRQTENLPKIPLLEKKRPGEPVWVGPIDIDPLQPHIYDGCTDIVFPIHTSPKFAEQVGLPGTILQGTATLALGVREIVNREADRDPARIKTIDCRFTGMVLPGTRIEIHLLDRQDGPRGRDLFFEVKDDAGRNAVSNGYVNIE